VRQVEPIAKHPVVRAIPFAKVDVPVPVTARKVVVAWVVVLLMPVKFCRVVEPVWSVFESVESPPVATRFVPTERAPVVVAFVVVEFEAVKFCRVDEPVTRRLMNCPVPPIAVAKVRFVVDALVAKRFVDVAFVVVPVVTVSEEMVVEAWERKPWNVGVPVNAGEMENTTEPAVPVSSVKRAASSADVSREVEEILLLKILQSVEANLPWFTEDAKGRLKVNVEPLPVTVKSVPVVEVARVIAGPVVVCPVGPIEVNADVKP